MPTQVQSFFNYIVDRDYQRANEWSLEIDAGTTSGQRADQRDDQNFGNLKFRVKSVNLPFHRLTTEVGGDGMVWYTQPEHESEITMVLYEDSRFFTWKYFNYWYQQVFDIKRRSFKDPTLGSGRLGTLNFWRFDQGHEEIARTFRLEGLKPINIQDLDLDYTNGEALTFSAVFSVQRVIDSIDYAAQNASTPRTATRRTRTPNNNDYVIYEPGIQRSIVDN